MVESEFKPVQIEHKGVLRLSYSQKTVRIDINGERYYADKTKVQQVLDGKRRYVTLYKFLNESKQKC